MVRRLASQVHKQVSRLLRGRYMKREPVWFQAVLDNPPLPLPAKVPPARTSFDLPRAVKQSAANPKPLQISYLEDEFRIQFFRDHPFEAFRPTTLVEHGSIESEHPITGQAWTRLRQRGRNPKPEDAIRFALNLHQYHDLSINKAYTTAISQFRALRSEHEIATTFAAIEAEHYGATFRLTETERGDIKESKALSTWNIDETTDPGAIAARKRWRMVAERDHPNNEWTGGEKYTTLWKQGVRPEYSLILNNPSELVTEESSSTQYSSQTDETSKSTSSQDGFGLAGITRNSSW